MKHVFGQPSKIHKIMIDIIVVNIAVSNIYPLHVYIGYSIHTLPCVLYTPKSIKRKPDLILHLLLKHRPDRDII